MFLTKNPEELLVIRQQASARTCKAFAGCISITLDRIINDELLFHQIIVAQAYNYQALLHSSICKSLLEAIFSNCPRSHIMHKGSNMLALSQKEIYLK